MVLPTISNVEQREPQGDCPEFMISCLVTLHVWGRIFGKFPEISGFAYADDGNIIGPLPQALKLISVVKLVSSLGQHNSTTCVWSDSTFFRVWPWPSKNLSRFHSWHVHGWGYRSTWGAPTFTSLPAAEVLHKHTYTIHKCKYKHTIDMIFSPCSINTLTGQSQMQSYNKTRGTVSSVEPARHLFNHDNASNAPRHGWIWHDT